MEEEGRPRRSRARSRARRSCSPARCRTSAARRPRERVEAAGARSPARSRRRPTTWWPAPTPARKLDQGAGARHRGPRRGRPAGAPAARAVLGDRMEHLVLETAGARGIHAVHQDGVRVVVAAPPPRSSPIARSRWRACRSSPRQRCVGGTAAHAVEEGAVAGPRWRARRRTPRSRRALYIAGRGASRCCNGEARLPRASPSRPRAVGARRARRAKAVGNPRAVARWSRRPPARWRGPSASVSAKKLSDGLLVSRISATWAASRRCARTVAPGRGHAGARLQSHGDAARLERVVEAGGRERGRVRLEAAAALGEQAAVVGEALAGRPRSTRRSRSPGRRGASRRPTRRRRRGRSPPRSRPPGARRPGPATVRAAAVGALGEAAAAEGGVAAAEEVDAAAVDALGVELAVPSTSVVSVPSGPRRASAAVVVNSLVFDARTRAVCARQRKTGGGGSLTSAT